MRNTILLNKDKDYSLRIHIIDNIEQLDQHQGIQTYIDFFKEQSDKKVKLPHFFIDGKWELIAFINKEEKQLPFQQTEQWRKLANDLIPFTDKQKITELEVIDGKNSKNTLAFVEGFVLGNYSFNIHKSKEKEHKDKESEINIVSNTITEKNLSDLSAVCESVFFCRDLVNEPVNFLNAEQMAERFEKEATPANIKVSILNKKEIEALKMGGLLGVNLGSVDPPTFTIMEWTPKNAINKKPYVLVGKGVVYDTGGLNLKTGSYMNDMKSDMGGAATVASAIIAIARLELPIQVIALIPATDNRPNNNALTSGDIITMMDGTTVEVLNTDAEGRLILADAIAYAARYQPELIIDAATLTGAAERAIGPHGIVAMHQDATSHMEAITESGLETYERIAEFPFWEEYGEDIKSKIADIKNLGDSYAGMITAGKFLSHFTNYPYIHLDIAGAAFLSKNIGYRPQGGTGTGVRLLVDFFKKKCQ